MLPEHLARRSHDLIRVLGILVLGQALLLLAGELAPGLVRFPGWGPQDTPDTRSYMRAASYLPNVAPEWWGKILYVVLLRVGMVLGSPGWTVVVLQIVGVTLAGLALLSLGRRSGHPRAGWIGAAILLINPQTAQWTPVVMTDSLFMSLMVLLLWASIRANDSEGGWGLPFLLAALAALLRPNGFLAIASVALLQIWRGRSGDRPLHGWAVPIRVALSALTIACVLAVVGLSPAHRSGTGGPDDHPLSRLATGEVVWDMPEWSRPMPAVEGPERSLGALVRYVAASPLQTLDLGLRRVGVEMIQVRPHYPAPVNIVIGGAMVVYLLGAAAGARSAAGARLRRPVLLLMAPMMAGIAITWASAEGRFGWAILVLLAPWVGLGLERLLLPGSRSAVELGVDPGLAAGKR